MSVLEENAGTRPCLSAPSDPFQDEQTVLILVGLIASGKVAETRHTDSTH